MVEVYDRRPVQANECLRIQFRFKRPNTLPQQVPLAASVQTHVVIGGFDPLDVTHRDDRSGVSTSSQKSMWAAQGETPPAVMLPQRKRFAHAQQTLLPTELFPWLWPKSAQAGFSQSALPSSPAHALRRRSPHARCARSGNEPVLKLLKIRQLRGFCREGPSLCRELASMREDGHHPESPRGLPGRSATGLNRQAAKEEVSALWRGGSVPENISGFWQGEVLFTRHPFLARLARNDVRSARACPQSTADSI
jgi:hypothetical protein